MFRRFNLPWRRGIAAAAVAAAALSAGSAAAAPDPATGQAGMTEPYHIGVWYFTRWSSATLLGGQGEGLYHRRDPWAGVRDFAEGHGGFTVIDPVTGRPQDYAGREPLLGFYDEMAQPVVDAHIKQAASEGIDFFAFYWYLDIDTGRERPIAAPVKAFFKSPVRGLIKYVLAPIILAPPHRTFSLATWKEVVVPEITGYMASDSYLRLEDRPVLIDFSVPFGGTDRAAAYESLRQAVRARVGADPLIIALMPGQATYNDLMFRRAHSHPDGFTCFNLGTVRPAEPYEELVQRWLPLTLRQVTRPDGTTDPATIYIPCGSLGMDARPWYKVGWSGYEGKTDPEARPYVTGVTPEKFRQHLLDIKAFIDSNKVNTLKTTIIYAWNEWGEAAASIEPSKALRYRYADMIRQVFRLHARSAQP
jgi:hypothetical protein